MEYGVAMPQHHRDVGADGDDYYGNDETDQLLEQVGEGREARVQPYVVVMFTLLGTGCLTPWNSLAGAIDFFGALLPNCDPADAFAVVLPLPFPRVCSPLLLGGGCVRACVSMPLL